MRRKDLTDTFGVDGLFSGAESDDGSLPHVGSVPRLVFVCTANISRSPYAELVTKHELGEHPRWVIASAGIPGTVGRVMDEQMVPRAVRRGVPLAACQEHRSRPLTVQMLDEATLVVTMEKRHRDAVLDLQPACHRRLFTLHQAHVAALALLAGGLPARSMDATEMVDLLLQNRPIASRREDVPDPYRKPSEVVDLATRTLDTYVGTLMGCLQLVS